MHFWKSPDTRLHVADGDNVVVVDGVVVDVMTWLAAGKRYPSADAVVVVQPDGRSFNVRFTKRAPASSRLTVLLPEKKAAIPPPKEASNTTAIRTITPTRRCRRATAPPRSSTISRHVSKSV